MVLHEIANEIRMRDEAMSEPRFCEPWVYDFNSNQAHDCTGEVVGESCGHNELNRIGERVTLCVNTLASMTNYEVARLPELWDAVRAVPVVVTGTDLHALTTWALNVRRAARQCGIVKE